MRKILTLLLCVSTLYMCSQTIPTPIDLGLSVNWASHNIGANQPEDIGKYIAWGETGDKSYYFFDTYEFTEKDVDYQSCIDIGDHIAMTTYDAAHVLWEGDWRMPTEKEFIELMEKCEWTWTTRNNVSGYDILGPNGNSIFLPAGGKKSGTQEIEAEGCYWSETVNGGIGGTARSLWFDEEMKNMWGEMRVSGLLIRPVVSNPNFVETLILPKEWQDPKYKELILAINDERYDDAYNEAIILAATDDAKAQCVLATMYMCGVGTFQNYESAQELLAQSAEQGYDRGEYMLGGFGSLAMQHEFLKALLGEDADQDEIDDNSFWYQMLSTETKPDNYKDAFRWFYLKDGEWGYRDIMYYAGIALIKGTYGYQNLEHGLNWLIRSARLGYTDAINVLKQLQDASSDE